jgi:hypothetical protein
MGRAGCRKNTNALQITIGILVRTERAVRRPEKEEEEEEADRIDHALALFGGSR